MRRNSKIVTGVIGLITVALIGLMGWQVYILNHVVRLELESFRQNVNAALSSIIQKLETHEAATKVVQITVNTDMQSAKKVGLVHLQNLDSTRQTNKITWATMLFTKEPNVRLKNKELSFCLAEKQKIQVCIMDSSGKNVWVMNEFRPAGENKVRLPDSTLKSGSYQVNFKTDSLIYAIEMVAGQPARMMQNSTAFRKKQRLVEKVVDELAFMPKLPIQQRINLTILDSLITGTLQEKGIELPVTFGIFTTDSDSLIFPKTVNGLAELRRSKFRSRLFPHDVLTAANELVLYFPDQKRYLIRQFGLIALIALVFIAMIIYCFSYVLRLIFKQKRFSKLLTDFINNMTHEFKTPISTISLASETLTNATILKDESRLQRYGQIIRDESFRMRRQVEKILQMAILEEGDYEYTFSAVNVHELIQKVVQNFTPKIDQLKGQITTELTANHPVIKADAVHLENIIHNLLDNAIKYTRRTPEIRIQTLSLPGKLQITVADNGIGIRPEEQQLVFEKYYRVPTGNVHDVKGFGLGLSYVKLIVEAHGGKIQLSSKPGKGSKFTIQLPETRQAS
ncbi:HAMP domain-containing histidine kinase [candidate division KSB1 bacterium]|nr:HAMP domain-containing histidine kinase [candidate division KSB1 bacterium]